jgi:hypothetical protein
MEATWSDYMRELKRLGLSAPLASTANGKEPADRGNADVGRKLALDACTGCHLVSDDQRFPPLLKGPPSFREIANGPNVTAASLQRTIAALPHGDKLSVNLRDTLHILPRGLVFHQPPALGLATDVVLAELTISGRLCRFSELATWRGTTRQRWPSANVHMGEGVIIGIPASGSAIAALTAIAVLALQRGIGAACAEPEPECLRGALGQIGDRRVLVQGYPLWRAFATAGPE